MSVKRSLSHSRRANVLRGPWSVSVHALVCCMADVHVGTLSSHRRRHLLPKLLSPSNSNDVVIISMMGAATCGELER